MTQGTQPTRPPHQVLGSWRRELDRGLSPGLGAGQEAGLGAWPRAAVWLWRIVSHRRCLSLHSCASVLRLATVSLASAIQGSRASCRRHGARRCWAGSGPPLDPQSSSRAGAQRRPDPAPPQLLGNARHLPALLGTSRDGGRTQASGGLGPRSPCRGPAATPPPRGAHSDVWAKWGSREQPGCRKPSMEAERGTAAGR